MKPLVLQLKETPPQRCDLSPLTPDRLALHSGPVEAIEIHTTRRRLCVGDLFRVVEGDPREIRFEGGSRRFDHVGAGMSQGTIRIDGDLGQQAGRGMSGGRLQVAGDVGRLVASGMSGGHLEVEGSAGDLAGGPLPGEMAGMNGGILHVHGDVGERAGDRMRRGLLVIGGAAGAGLGSRMIAGTIACGGRAARGAGCMMRRGTLVLAGGTEEMALTFVDTGTHDYVVLRLLAAWLRQQGVQFPAHLAASQRRLVGDTATLGKGEVFIPAGLD